MILQFTVTTGAKVAVPAADVAVICEPPEDREKDGAGSIVEMRGEPARAYLAMDSFEDLVDAWKAALEIGARP